MQLMMWFDQSKKLSCFGLLRSDFSKVHGLPILIDPAKADGSGPSGILGIIQFEDKHITMKLHKNLHCCMYGDKAEWVTFLKIYKEAHEACKHYVL